MEIDGWNLHRFKERFDTWDSLSNSVLRDTENPIGQDRNTPDMAGRVDSPVDQAVDVC